MVFVASRKENYRLLNQIVLISSAVRRNLVRALRTLFPRCSINCISLGFNYKRGTEGYENQSLFEIFVNIAENSKLMRR